MADVVCQEYASTLNDLTFNSKPHISMLTMLAEENIQYAPKIVQVIEAHLQKVKPELKLPTMYLVDSIIKNIGGNYLGLFTQNIVSAFCNVFEKVDEKTRIQLFKLRQTWSDVFPNKKLYAIDVRVNQMDPAWPIIAQASIHVNPKFLSKTSPAAEEAEASKKNDQESMQEAEMRKQLIAKQQELLKIQQQKLELELLQAKAKLEEQKKLLKQQKDLQENNPVKEEPQIQPPVADFKCMNLSPADIPVPKIPVVKPQNALIKESNLAKDPRFARDPRVMRGPNHQIDNGCKTDSLTPVQQLHKPPSLHNVSRKQQPQASVADLGNGKVTPSLPISNEMLLPPKVVEKTQEKQNDAKNQQVKPLETKKQEVPMKNEKSPKKKVDKETKKIGKSEAKVDAKPVPKDPKKDVKIKDDSKKNIHVKKEKKTEEKIIELDSDKNTKQKVEKDRKISPGNKKDHEEKYDNCKTNKRDLSDRKEGSFAHKSFRNRRSYRSNRKDSESPDNLKRMDEKNFPHDKFFKRYRDKEKTATNRGRSRSPLYADKSSNKDEKRVEHKGRKNIKTESENKEKTKVENYQVEKTDVSKLNEGNDASKSIDVDLRLNNNKEKGLQRDSEAKENKEVEETVEEPPAKKIKQVETDENVVDELFGCKDQDYRQLPPNSQSPLPPCSPAQGGWAKYKAEHPDEFKSPLRPMNKNPFGFGTQDLDLRLLHKSESSVPVSNAPNESNNSKQAFFGGGRGKYQQSFRKIDPKMQKAFSKQGKASVRLQEDSNLLRKHPMYQRLQSEEESHPDMNIPNALMFERQAEVLKQAEQQLKAGQITSEQYREIMNQLGKLYELQLLRQKQKEEQFKEKLFSNRRRDSYGSGRRERQSKYGNVRSYNLGEIRETSTHGTDILESLPSKDNSVVALPSSERQMNLTETKKLKTDNSDSFRVSTEDNIKPLQEKNYGAPPSLCQPKEDDMDIVGQISEKPKTVIKDTESPSTKISSEEKSVKKLQSSDSRLPTEQLMRTITIDDQIMNIRTFGSTTVVYNKDTEPREVLFLGSPTNVFIGDQIISLGFEGDSKNVVLDGKSYNVKFGAPTQEIFIDNTPYEARFEGPPIEVILNNKVYNVRLGGPPPKVEFRELNEDIKSLFEQTVKDSISKDSERNFENKGKYSHKGGIHMSENIVNSKKEVGACFNENKELNKGRISELPASHEKSRSPLHYGSHRSVIPDCDERRESRDVPDYRKSRSPQRLENRGHAARDVPDPRGMTGSHYDPHFSGPQHGPRYDSRQDHIHPEDRNQERHMNRHGFREHFPFRERRDEWRDEQWREEHVRHTPEEPIYRGEHPYPRNYDVRNTRDMSHRDEYVPSYWHRNDLPRDEPRPALSGPQHEDIIPGGHILHRDRGQRQNSPQHLMDEYSDNSRMLPYRQMPPYRENMSIREAMPRGANLMGPRMMGPRPRFDVRHRFDIPRPRFDMRIRGDSLPRMDAVRIRDDRILMPNPRESAPYVPESVHQLHIHPMGPQDYYPSNIISSRPDYIQHPDPSFAQLPSTGFTEASQEIPATVPNPVPQVDISELFQKLVSAGILATATAEAKKEKEEEKEVVKEPVVPEEPVVKPVDAEADKIPSIEFTSESLKAHYPGVIAQLYKGIQCSSCGVRFTSEQTEKYAQHLDWHFRQNRRERDSAKKATSRKWFYDTQDWIQFEEVEDLEERARSFFEIQAHEEQDQAEELPSVPVGENEEDNICVVCGEPFEQFWDEEKEEWHLRDALRIEEKPYHPVCYEDIKNLSAAERPPSDDQIDQDIVEEIKAEDTEEMEVDEMEPVVIKKENELDLKEKDSSSSVTEKIDCTPEVTEIQDPIIAQVNIKKDPDASVTSVSQCLEINKNVFVDSMQLLSKDLTTINVTDSAITKIKVEPVDKPIKIKFEPIAMSAAVPPCNVTVNVEAVEKPVDSLCNISVKQEPVESVEINKVPFADSLISEISIQSADVNGSKSTESSLPLDDGAEVKQKENETAEEPEDEQNAEMESDEHKFTVLPPVMKGKDLSGLCTIL